MISGFEEPDESISEKLSQSNFLKDIELSSDVQILVFNPPLKQLQIGISPENVVCREGLQLIHSIHGNPACVKNESVGKLIDRGWATS